jgi:hypothetical protein
MEHSNHIPDDLPTCQELLRSTWERLRELERQLDEFVATTEELKRAQICFSILANAKRYSIEPFAYVKALLIALSSDEVDLEPLLPDVWIGAHPEYVLKYRRDEAEAAANARRRRRALRRQKKGKPSLSS